MPELTGGQAIVSALRAHGIRHVFGLPGAQLYPLFDALAQAAPEIRTYSARHEQTAGYMALGYAKSTGTPAVYAVVPGPGVLNTSAALCTALGGNAPVLCLTGEVPAQYQGRGRGHLHELPDQLATLRTLTKWAEHLERVESVPDGVGRAFREMRSGRPGPVALSMCWDTLGVTAQLPEARAAQIPPPPEPDSASVEAAASLLAQAKAPMILVGGGAQHAREAVLELAEALDAPVTAFRSGRGVVPADHELALTSAEAYELWAETDLLIGIGSRLELPYMRWGSMTQYQARPEPPPNLIRIDIDAGEMERLRPQAAVVADAALGARALAAAVADSGRPDSGRRARLQAARKAAAVKVERIQPHKAYLDSIRQVLPRDGFFVEELCQAGFTSYFAFLVYVPRTYVTAGYQGTLGFGYPTALGVKAAHPGRAVVSIAGDGGFLFGASELATAVQERLAVVSIVFNNGSYGNVRRDQMERYDGRLIGSQLHNPDFMKLAESFGVWGRRVDSPEGLVPVLDEALALDQPALIEVQVDSAAEISPWSLIHPAASY